MIFGKCRMKVWLYMGLTVIVLLMGVWSILFMRQQEYAKALSMQAMLINVAIAQEAYYHTHQHFTTQWADILPMVAKPASLQLQLRTVPDRPDTYWMGFGAASAHPKEYEVVLFVMPDEKQIQLTAKRIGSTWFDYQLVRMVPDGQSQCLSGWKNKSFCRYILEKSEQLELKNLIPVSSAG